MDFVQGISSHRLNQRFPVRLSKVCQRFMEPFLTKRHLGGQPKIGKPLGIRGEASILTLPPGIP
jgi:hypothetical protein